MRDRRSANISNSKVGEFHKICCNDLFFFLCTMYFSVFWALQVILRLVLT